MVNSATSSTADSRSRAIPTIETGTENLTTIDEIAAVAANVSQLECHTPSKKDEGVQGDETDKDHSQKSAKRAHFDLAHNSVEYCEKMKR
jgi:hypothetical protein